MMADFILNGMDVSVHCDPRERLSDILHDRLGVASVRKGCGTGRCGSCLVLLDGKAVPSCIVPAFQARSREIITYEGLQGMAEHEDLSRAFREAGVDACAYCLPGKYVLAEYLAERLKEPDRDAIRRGLSGASCRCDDGESMVAAIELAIEYRRERRYGKAV
jgi:carbon-monoxide dehydrogenase small subunit